MTWLGAFGGGSIEPLELWTNSPEQLFAEHLVRTQQHAKLRVLQNPENRAKLTQRVGERRWVTGTQNLKASQEYPPELCEAIASLVASFLPNTVPGAAPEGDPDPLPEVLPGSTQTGMHGQKGIAQYFKVGCKRQRRDTGSENAEHTAGAGDAASSSGHAAAAQRKPGKGKGISSQQRADATE